MKLPGLVGGIGPESTIDYYKRIIEGYRERVQDGSYPRLVINSVNAKFLIDSMQAERLTEIADFLVSAIEVLAQAGADFAAIGANTPHVVFPEVSRRSPLPLISIVEATREEAKRRGLRRIGLFGTRYTMAGRFYPDVFENSGVELVVPGAEDQAYIHEKYMGELFVGNFLPETRAGLARIARRLKTEQRIEGLILGGTELPLILEDPAEVGVPLLDTTRIHADAIVGRMLE